MSTGRPILLSQTLCGRRVLKVLVPYEDGGSVLVLTLFEDGTVLHRWTSGLAATAKIEKGAGVVEVDEPIPEVLQKAIDHRFDEARAWPPLLLGRD